MDHSSKEVVMAHGIEAVQPGLEPVPNHHPHYFHPMPAVAHQTVPAEPRICGLRRMTFWLALIVSCLLLVVIGLAVGLGVGLSSLSTVEGTQRSVLIDYPELNSTSAAPSPSEAVASSGASATSVASTIISSTTSSTSAATATATSATSATSGNSLPTPTTTVQFDKDTKYTCPSTNNTELQNVSRVNAASADADKSNYHVFCDADINSDDKQDLAAMVLSSFADCLGFCNSMNNFQDRADVACTYNFEGTGGQDKGTCWCLAGGGKKVVSNPGNMVAVLSSENVDWQG